LLTCANIDQNDQAPQSASFFETEDEISKQPVRTDWLRSKIVGPEHFKVAAAELKRAVDEKKVRFRIMA
jgi:hypothetical protein